MRWDEMGCGMDIVCIVPYCGHIVLGIRCDGSLKAEEATSCTCTVREIVCITRVEFVIGIIGMIEIAILMPLIAP